MRDFLATRARSDELAHWPGGFALDLRRASIAAIASEDRTGEATVEDEERMLRFDPQRIGVDLVHADGAEAELLLLMLRLRRVAHHDVAEVAIIAEPLGIAMPGKIDHQPVALLQPPLADEELDRLVKISSGRIHQLDYFEALSFEHSADLRDVCNDSRQLFPAIVVIADADDQRVALVVQINLLAGFHLDLDALATLLSCHRMQRKNRCGQ